MNRSMEPTFRNVGISDNLYIAQQNTSFGRVEQGKHLQREAALTKSAIHFFLEPQLVLLIFRSHLNSPNVR